MSSIVEFGFDDGKTIKSAGIEKWKQGRSGESNRVSIIAFKRYYDVILAGKVRDKGSDLSDQEKAELSRSIDEKLAKSFGKTVEELTDVDRLDIKQPKFSFAWTHFGEGVGTIRCHGKYEGTTLKQPGPCCDKLGDAEQTVATVVLIYPVDEHLQVDQDDLMKKKHTTVGIWSLGHKKFKKLEGVYISARKDKREIIDLSITLDGDPKYQKQQIEYNATAFWALKETPREIYQWVLDQGVRGYKQVNANLGYEMSRDKLIERLGLPGGSAGALPAAATASAPVAQTSYDDLIA